MKAKAAFLTSVAIGLLGLGGRGGISLGLVTLGWLVLFFPVVSWLRWAKAGHRDVPVFSMALVVPVVSFVVPLFLEEDLAVPTLGFFVQPDEADLLRAMSMVLTGVLGMVLGHFWSRGVADLTRGVVDGNRPVMPGFASGVLALGVLVSATGFGFVGGGFREVVRVLTTAVPIVAVVLLMDEWLQGKAGRREKILIVSWLFVATIQGLASGWLGAVATGPLIIGLTILRRKGRFPLGVLAPIAFVLLFLQPAKTEFRRQFWYGDKAGTVWEKGQFWLEGALDYWGGSSLWASREDSLSSIQPVVSRTSLLPFACLIQRLTPDVVPYQGLAPYKYLVVGLIPRFLWPDKPQFDDANRFVQVAYGLTREENLSQVSMAVGIFSEGYMAAGWIGVLLASGVLGGVCALIESVLGRAHLGALPNAIAIALLPRFLIVESQMTQLVSGLLQTVLVCWVVFSIGMPRIRNARFSDGGIRSEEANRESSGSALAGFSSAGRV